jgi:hypothetical protein
MAVLNRKLFNRGGRVSSRGVGITSGLVPRYSHGGPVGEHTTKERFEDNMEMLRGLGLTKEREPFSRLAAASPALLTLGSGLLSGTSFQGGLGGALDILGQAAGAASPQFGEAIKAKQEYDATDPEAGLKEMALEMALEEKPSNKLKSFEPVYGTFGTGENKQTGYGFAKVFEDGEIKYEYAGQDFSAFAGLAEPETPKDEKYFKAEKVSIRKKPVLNESGEVLEPAGDPFDVFFQSGDQGGYKFTGLDKKGDFSSDEYEIYDPDGNFDFLQNIKIKRKGSEIEEDASQVFNKNTGEMETRLTDGTVLDKQTFTITEVSDKKETYAQKPYKITINGTEYDTTARQEGTETFVFDPRPNSPTQGQFINLNDIEGVQSFFESKTANFRSTAEEIELLKKKGELEDQQQTASEGYDKIISDSKSADVQLANYNTALLVLDTATTGSFASQRNSLLRFFETFNLDETMPGMYKGLEAAFNAGKTASTEVLEALSMNAFISNAQRYDDRLNQTEVNKILAADFGITLTNDGARLLIEINKAQDEIYSDAGDMLRNMVAGTKGGVDGVIEQYGDVLGEDVVKQLKELSEDNKISKVDAVLIADNYISKELREFGNSEDIKNKINNVLKKDLVGGKSYFYGLGNREMGQTGISVNLGEAYDANQIQFAGYSKDGFFEFDDQQSEENKGGFDDNKPIYILYFIDKSNQRQRAIMQF